MDLRSFYIKPLYNSIRDDPYFEFFIPAFSNSNDYRRYGGFFSSKNLAMCAEGIQEFLKNNGIMKLVLAPIFTKKDTQAIKEGVLTPEKFVNDSWSQALDSIKDQIQKDHVRALAWLIAQDPPRLEIKITIIKDSEGNVLDKNTIEERGFAYQSIGIYHDENGNSISFRGIIKPGRDHVDDFFEFQVHKSWIKGQKEFVNEDFETFRNYWDESEGLIGDIKETKYKYEILNLPEVIKNKILDMAPATLEELELKKLPKLRKYQSDSVNNWLNHGRRGIFQMATGTGKTFCAIGCIKALEKMEKKLLVIVACPTQNLVKQWEEELKKWNLSSFNTLGDKKTWMRTVQRRINDYNYQLASTPSVSTLITTYATFSSEELGSIVEKSSIPMMLIADEVHVAGAEQTTKGLIEKYEFRLGLSATSSRYFDIEGTHTLMNYFRPTSTCNTCNDHGSVVYSLELRDAIQREFLVEYDYFPHYVSLTDDELDEYRRKTRLIAVELSKTKEEDKRKELIELLYFKRADIIKNASNKIDKFKKIIYDNKSLEYCIIYCASTHKKNEQLDQMSQVQKILDHIPTPNHRIKSGEISLKERMDILDKLERGLLKAVIALQILDEGVDIPPLKNAIILSSTGNPRQFIQRRGRVLRKWDGKYPDGTTKDYATIHDIFVIPYLNTEIDKEYLSLEKTIVIKELARHKEMAAISRNPNWGITKINEIKKKYGINDSDENTYIKLKSINI